MRFNTITSLITDGSHNPPKDSGSGVQIISAKNLSNGTVDFNASQRFMMEKDFIKEDKRTQIKRGDFLLSIVGSIGKTVIVDTDTKFTAQRSVSIVKPILVDTKFVQYLFQTPFITTFMNENATGTAQRGIYLHSIKNIALPLPPLAEQERIVAKLEELFVQVDDYGVAYEKLEKLHGGIDQKIKDAILWQIASGQLISGTRKIEKDKPFDIPEDWSWKTLGEISSLSLGKTPDSKNAAYWNGDIDWVSISDMQNGIVADTSRKITEKAVIDKMGVPTPAGTLIMSFKLSIGKVAILSKAMYHNEAIAAINVNESIVTNQWLYTILPLMVTFGASSNAVKGSTLNKKSMQALQIPVPALDVQIELVDLYNEIMNKI